MYCIIHIQNPAYYCKFRYSGIFTSDSDLFSHIVAYLKPCVTFVYSKSCHIQNPGIFRTQVIFRTISKTFWHILVVEYLIDIELPPNINWESSPDIFKYNKTIIHMSHCSSHLCHPFWILASLKIFLHNSSLK